MQRPKLPAAPDPLPQDQDSSQCPDRMSSGAAGPPQPCRPEERHHRRSEVSLFRSQPTMWQVPLQAASGACTCRPY
ncbi:hypothetical protein [Lysobacter gummosus]|uniref:hypothetical protein n=1 Tax=Lysobacter gummosus TaxID=262324 RepID=UPI0036292A7A